MNYSIPYNIHIVSIKAELPMCWPSFENYNVGTITVATVRLHHVHGHK